MSLEISSNMSSGVESTGYDNYDNNESLLFFFLLLVLIFCNCPVFDGMDESLLFFFLILIIIFNRCYDW